MECRLTTFEGADHGEFINPENGGLIEGSNARFEGWVALATGTNNPSEPTFPVWFSGSRSGSSLDVTFDFPVAKVSTFYTSNIDVTLDAYDASGLLVETMTTPQTANLITWLPTGVAVAENVITRVTINGMPGGTGIDDFENCFVDLPPPNRPPPKSGLRRCLVTS